MIPDNVEKIIMTKEDYDRNVEQLLVEKLELEQELQRKDNIINELKEIYIKTCNHLFEIGNDELARYLKAQVDENNTFFVGKM